MLRGIESLVSLVKSCFQEGSRHPQRAQALIQEASRFLGIDPPVSLQEAATPLAIYLWMNPEQLFKVGGIFEIGPDQVRDFFGCEFRADRLLPEGHYEVETILTRNIHARPVVMLIHLLERHPHARVWIKRGRNPHEIRLKPSIMLLLPLALERGENITWAAVGPTAKKLMRELKAYNDHGWNVTVPKSSLCLIEEIPHRSPEEAIIKICAFMEEEGANVLSGVYDIKKDRLFVASSEMSHNEIAEKAGIVNPFDMTRINFEKTGNFLRALFPRDDNFEGLGGFPILTVWFADLLKPEGVLTGQKNIATYPQGNR